MYVFRDTQRNLSVYSSANNASYLVINSTGESMSLPSDACIKRGQSYSIIQWIDAPLQSNP